MATVYKIKIRTVSAWVNYTPQQINEKLAEILNSQKVIDLENTTIEVERVKPY